MQDFFDGAGDSHVSLLDGALGVVAGLGVPYGVTKLINKYAENPTVLDYAPMIAAGSGVVLAIPLGLWRGFGPAIIAGLVALCYAGIHGLDMLLEAVPAGTSDAMDTSAATELGRGRAVGALKAGPRQRVRRSMRGVRPHKAMGSVSIQGSAGY